MARAICLGLLFPETYDCVAAPFIVLEKLEGIDEVFDGEDAVASRLNRTGCQVVDDFGYVSLVCLRIGFGPSRPNTSDDIGLFNEQQARANGFLSSSEADQADLSKRLDRRQ